MVTRPPSAPASLTEALDTRAHAAVARAFSSLSPQSSMLAWMDWASHIAVSPGKQMELAHLAQEQTIQFAEYMVQCLLAGSRQARAIIEPPAQDRRFQAPEWRYWPYNILHQQFLFTQQWWEAAARGVRGVDPHHENMVAFFARQWLDMFSPGNRMATNPVVLKRTLDQGGLNLLRGMQYFIDNVQRRVLQRPPAGAEEYVVGKNVAVTPGKVVLRNPLIELIQYSPTTDKVRPEPILVVPAWIMKYYILDLSPHNSLIKYLVDNGHTVFCISWKNPGPHDHGWGMEDYLETGFFAALDAVNAIVPDKKVHATGYCLGGTLLSLAASAMARDDDDRLASMTLFAAQTEFSEPGELGLFIDESQVSTLESQMNMTGLLRADQMAGAFQMLRSYDLLWSRLVNEYLLGERATMNDLMAWNADTTRLPARMHSQYLRRLFLNDDLSEGRYEVHGRPVSLGSLNLPIFCVGTQTDHVAPWRSVYKLHNLAPAEITFVLTSGGHNAGIVSQPGHPRRNYQIRTREHHGGYIGADEWASTVPSNEGSWWPEWLAWLRARSGAPAKPPHMGAARQGYKVLEDAPGQYVKEK